MNLQKLLPLLLIVAVSSCVQNTGQKSASYTANTANDATSDTTTAVSIGTATDINSPNRKIIKTADVRCRVKDVYQATEHLETLVRNVGGQVSESKTENQQGETKRQAYATDSIKEITVYTTASHLTLKVPVLALDSVLRDIPAIASFIDARHLKLDDVTYQYLTNQMKNDAAKDLTALALKKSKKSTDVTGVSEYDDQRNETQIDRKINNLQMLDQVRYATLTVDLYQPSRIDINIIADTDRISQPGFGYRLRQSLLAGWEFVVAAFLVFLKIWPLVLVALAALFIVRRRRMAILSLDKRNSSLLEKSHNKH